MDFEDLRLVQGRSYDCHSTDAAELRAGLYVDSREGMLKGGESGAAVVVGLPAKSLLISAVKYEANEMPPDRKLEQRQIDALTRWVEMGAPWPHATSSSGVPTPDAKKDWSSFDWDEAREGHWAWQPVRRPDIPAMENESVANPIDNFVEARRAQAGLRAAPLAAPHILVRRICRSMSSSECRSQAT